MSPVSSACANIVRTLRSEVSQVPSLANRNTSFYGTWYASRAPAARRAPHARTQPRAEQASIQGEARILLPSLADRGSPGFRRRAFVSPGAHRAEPVGEAGVAKLAAPLFRPRAPPGPASPSCPTGLASRLGARARMSLTMSISTAHHSCELISCAHATASLARHQPASSTRHSAHSALHAPHCTRVPLTRYSALHALCTARVLHGVPGLVDQKRLVEKVCVTAAPPCACAPPPPRPHVLSVLLCGSIRREKPLPVAAPPRR